MNTIAPEETFVLIKHPAYDSFAVINVIGDCPKHYPKPLERLLPGNQDGHLDGVVVSSSHPYLEYLKKEWPEGLRDFTKSKIQDVEGLRYRLAVQYMMM